MQGDLAKADAMFVMADVESAKYVELAKIGIGMVRFLLAENLPNRSQEYHQGFVAWLERERPTISRDFDAITFEQGSLSADVEAALTGYQRDLYKQSQMSFEQVLELNPQNELAKDNLKIVNSRLK